MRISKLGKLLYRGFGIKDVIIKWIDFIEGALVFNVETKQCLRKCSKCNSRNVKKKQSKLRRLRLIPLGKMQCWLEIMVHKFYCHDCHSSTWMKLPFAAGKLPMTISYVQYTLSLIKIGTVQGIAIFLGLHWKTVKNIHKDYLQKKYEKISYKNIVYLSMDEFAIKKGHKYMTVFLDLCTGRIVYVCEGRSIECIEPFLQKLKKRAKKLLAIAMDLSPTYISAIKSILPHVAIVFDRFHVVKLLNNMMDDLRKSEREACLKVGLDVGKGDRFLFLKNFGDLNTNQQGRLEQLFEINKVLAKVYFMKEQFRTFWEQSTIEKAACFLIAWICEALASDIPALQKMAYSMINHGEGLLSYYDHRISNGRIEGTNNKIKVLKRRGYGYRDMDYFKLLLYDLHASKQVA